MTNAEYKGSEWASRLGSQGEGVVEAADRSMQLNHFIRQRMLFAPEMRHIANLIEDGLDPAAFTFSETSENPIGFLPLLDAANNELIGFFVTAEGLSPKSTGFILPMQLAPICPGEMLESFLDSIMKAGATLYCPDHDH
jgi:hypothetical protein